MDFLSFQADCAFWVPLDPMMLFQLFLILNVFAYL